MKVEALYKLTSKVDSAKLEIFGPIGSGGFTLQSFRAATSGVELVKLEIDINSPGGDPVEAFAIHDEIKNMKARVTVNIIGVAASAATIIAAAADRVTITENSRYLVHESSMSLQGKKDDIKDGAQMLHDIDNQMIGVYVKRTGKSALELESLMKKDTFLSATEALEWGFVDEIISTNKLKIAAMAEEKEKPDNGEAKIKAMEEEIKDLKAKLKALEEENDEYKAKAEKDEEEEIEALVEAAITEGKIKAESKPGWVELAKVNKATVKASFDGIVVTPVSLKDVTKPEAKDAPVQAKTKAEAWDLYKQGVIKTQMEYSAIASKLEK